MSKDSITQKIIMAINRCKISQAPIQFDRQVTRFGVLSHGKPDSKQREVHRHSEECCASQSRYRALTVRTDEIISWLKHSRYSSGKKFMKIRVDDWEALEYCKKNAGKIQSCRSQLIGFFFSFGFITFLGFTFSLHSPAWLGKEEQVPQAPFRTHC